MCVNEEDGLEFRVLQQTDGARQLRVFWQDADVTDRTSDFKSLIRTHPLSAVIRLRVVTVVQVALGAQLERLQSSTPPDAAPSSLQREACFRAALALREIETGILERAIEALEEEVSTAPPQATNPFGLSGNGGGRVAATMICMQAATNWVKRER
jgi:hypothetical protein